MNGLPDWERHLTFIEEKTGLPRKDIKAVLDAEWWFWTKRPIPDTTGLSDEEKAAGIAALLRALTEGQS